MGICRLWALRTAAGLAKQNGLKREETAEGRRMTAKVGWTRSGKRRPPLIHLCPGGTHG